MKFYATSSELKFRWDQVCASMFKRYPNPWSSHVLSEDVISRRVENSTLKTIRLLTKTNKAPKWVEKVVTSNTACIVEESHVNPVERKVVTYTKNLSLRSFMTVEEKCEYTISEESKDWTLVKRQAWITSGLYGVSRAVEMFGFERYKANIKKSKKGFEYVLNKMYTPDKVPSIINVIPVPHTI